MHQLQAALDRGQQAWPTLVVEPTAFCRYLGKKLEGSLRLADLLAEDLYLACALAANDATAIKLLQRELLPQIVAVLAKRGGGLDGVDELTQKLHEHLLVGTAQRAGRIADYAGRGSLRAWIIVAAVRMQHRADLRARRSATLPLISVADARLDEAEGALVKQEYREPLARACAKALLELPPRERALLRLQLVDGASIDQIGRIYGVHRATAARWLARARAMILQRTHRELAQSLGVDAAAAASIARVVHSQLDVSVARFLETSSS